MGAPLSQSRELLASRMTDRSSSIFVKGLSAEVSSETLRAAFAKYGDIASAVVQFDQAGVSRGFGFVNFFRPQDADEAVAQHSGGPWMVRKAERKPGAARPDNIGSADACNLYVRGLEPYVSRDRLQSMFEAFGTVLSSKILTDLKTGASKCAGFVQFSAPGEAARAMAEMNGKEVGSKVLHVMLAQKRPVPAAAPLKAAHALQELQNGMQQPPSIPPGMAYFPPSAPGAALYYPAAQAAQAHAYYVYAHNMYAPNGMPAPYQAYQQEQQQGYPVQYPAYIPMMGPAHMYHQQQQQHAAQQLQQQQQWQQQQQQAAAAQQRQQRAAQQQAQEQARQQQQQPPPPPPQGRQEPRGALPQAPLPPSAVVQQRPVLQAGYDGPTQAAVLPGGFYHRPVAPAAAPAAAARGRGRLRGAAGRARGGGARSAATLDSSASLGSASLASSGSGPLRTPAAARADAPSGGKPAEAGTEEPGSSLGALMQRLRGVSDRDKRMSLLGEALFNAVRALQPEIAAKVTGMCLEMSEAEILNVLSESEALRAKVDEAMRVLQAAGYQQAEQAPASAAAEASPRKANGDANAAGAEGAPASPPTPPEAFPPSPEPDAPKQSAESDAPPRTSAGAAPVSEMQALRVD